MMLMDKKGGRDDTFHGVLSGQLTFPMMFISPSTFCTSRSACSPCLLSVYTADLASYLLNQVDQPATKLKSLIDSNTEFYVMSGSAELQMEFDQGPLTANLQGGYSIVSDPETTLKPIVVPYMMSRKWSSRNVDLSYDEMPAMPLGIASDPVSR
jgi:hypothetical protein